MLPLSFADPGEEVLLAAAVVLIAVKLIRDRKKGKSSCGCGYSSCLMSGTCHKKN